MQKLLVTIIRRWSWAINWINYFRSIGRSLKFLLRPIPRVHHSAPFPSCNNYTMVTNGTKLCSNRCEEMGIKESVADVISGLPSSGNVTNCARQQYSSFVDLLLMEYFSEWYVRVACIFRRPAIVFYILFCAAPCFTLILVAYKVYVS
jgi:hypothetical protein